VSYELINLKNQVRAKFKDEELKLEIIEISKV